MLHANDNQAFDIVKKYLQASETEKIVFFQAQFQRDSSLIQVTYDSLSEFKKSVKKHADDQKHVDSINEVIKRLSLQWQGWYMQG